MSDEPLRRTPDRLLQHRRPASRQTESVLWRLRRGGKTWAMLAEAQRLRAQGWIF